MSLTLNKCKTYKCDDHVSNIAKNLRTFYEAEEFLDAVLIAGIDDVEVRVHRIVLSASSNYFLGMFRSKLKESKAEDIRLEELDGSTLKVLVDFMYTASIDLHSETIKSVLRAAELFQMNSLIAACCDFMGELLDSCNCLGIALLADKNNHKELYKKANAFAYKHFEQVCTEKEFFQLDEGQLNQFFLSDDLAVISQEKLFHSLVSWVEHDIVNREKSIVCLMSHVHFALLDSKFIINNSKSVCKSIEGYELIRSWLQWHLSPESRSPPDATACKRMQTNNELCFISGKYTDFIELQTYNPQSKKWSYEKCSYPTTRREFGGTVINKKFIVAGNVIADDSVECWDLQTKERTYLPKMKSKRQSPAITELNGDLYVVGGVIDGMWSCTVEKYDFTTRTWQDISSLPALLIEVQVVALGGLLYAVGYDHPFLECYNPATNKWIRKASRTEKVDFYGIAAVDRYLYAVGGCKPPNGKNFLNYKVIESNVVERYDPLKNSWTVVSPLNVGRSHIKCAAFNNRLIACEGRSERGWVNLVDEYNPETNKWKTLPPLLSHSRDFFDLFLI